MPMRFFIYAAKLYEKYITSSDYYQYSSALQAAPRPRCICFYNGMANQPEETILRLSDVFGGEADIEVCVKMLNINYGKNKALMDACRPLNEYAWLVDKIRNFKRNIEAAIDVAIADMPYDFLIKKFLLSNKAEVKVMFLTEWDQEKILNQAVNDDRRRVATDMLRDGELLEKILRYSRLTKEAIRSIANNLGIVM